MKNLKASCAYALAMAPLQLLQHKHCKVCGKAIPASRELCSGKCEQDWARREKKRKNTMLYYFIGLIATLILLFLLLMRGV